MQLEEIDIALEELETRLERLRSLYEQYFLGIEKVEPSIARKDVDRRFWILRRTKVRNTARRFRLQLLVQRYNTFQQYWMRTCRQIENGTYHRHVRRAEAAFGKEALTIASQRRERAMTLALEKVPGSRRLTPGGRAAASDSQEGAPAAPPPSNAGGFAGVPPAASAAFSDAPPSSLPQSSTRVVDVDRDVERAFARISIPPKAPAAPSLTPTAVRPSIGPDVHTKRTTRMPAIPAKDAARPATGLPPVPPAPAPPLTRSSRPPRPRSYVPPGAAAAGPSFGSPRVPREQASISDQRIRELHDQLLSEKRKLADPSTVSYDSLAKSLQDAASKLRSVHGPTRQVDFRVVIKGGKALVKPVLK